MTIAAAYVTSDGVVLGSDSTTTVLMEPESGSSAPQVGQILNHAQKIFAVGPKADSRFAICTWGLASLGATSHRTVAALVADKKPKNVEEATQALIDTVRPKYLEIVQKVPSATGIPLGYFVAGADSSTHEPGCKVVTFEGTAAPKIKNLAVGEAIFQGVPNFFTRVFWGFDPDGITILKTLLRTKLNLQPDQFDSSFDGAYKQARELTALRGVQDIPIREAIDFLYSLLHVTVKALKFRGGPPICGGPIEVGFITTDRPFRWARHKDFTSAVSEQEGGENAD
jgi:hypothetical protein